MTKKRLNLINARHEAKLTQEELGSLVGATKKRISAIETGACGTRTELWDRLEDVLKIHQRELRKLSETESTPRPNYSNSDSATKEEVV
jgi:DNA-binding XRE family transcriptional regulator